MTSTPEIKFAEVFPQPFLQCQWPDSEALNRELKRIVLDKYETARGRSDWRGSTMGGWHTRKIFQTLPEPCVRGLLARIDLMIRNMVSYLVPNPGTEHLEGWKVVAWANVNHHGHFNRSHNHSFEGGTAFSGIYYVDPGVPRDEHGMGRTVFEDWSGVPREVARDSNPYRGEIVIDPVPGLMLIFPGHLRHRVEPHPGQAPRITIAFNLSHPRFIIPEYRAHNEESFRLWMWKYFRGIMQPAGRLKMAVRRRLKL